MTLHEHPTPATPMPETSGPSRLRMATAGAALTAAAIGGVGLEAHLAGDHLAPNSHPASHEAPAVAGERALPMVSDPLPPKPTDIPNLATLTPPQKHHKPVEANTPVIQPKVTIPHKPEHKSGKVTVEVPYELPVITFPDLPDNPDDLDLSEYERRHIETPAVPEDVATHLKANTLYFNGCSGELINDQAGTPVGFLTAEHCYLRAVDTPRILGTDGQRYIVKPELRYVATGDSKDSLNYSLPRVNQFIIPTAEDMSLDLAFGVLDGHTAQEVLDSYQSLSNDEINQLQFGDPIYMSGWPARQANNHGTLKRQTFAMNFLGTQVVTTTNNESIKMVLAAVKDSPDGAACSFGASGSEGMVKDANGQLRSVGTLAAYYDLVGDTWGGYENAELERRFLESEFKVDLTGYTALCGFAYETPTGNIGMSVNAVDNVNQIPGHEYENYKGGPLSYDQYLIPQEIYDQARADFASQPRTVLNGMVELIGSKDVTRIQNPYFWYDPNAASTRDAMIGWYDPSAPDHLQLAYYGQPGSRVVYDLDSTPGVEILTSTGELQTTEDSFVDSAGQAFGTLLSTRPNVTNVHDVSFNEDGTLNIGGGFGVK